MSPLHSALCPYPNLPCRRLNIYVPSTPESYIEILMPMRRSEEVGPLEVTRSRGWSPPVQAGSVLFQRPQRALLSLPSREDTVRSWLSATRKRILWNPATRAP